MGAIFEKGMMIGFGFILLILLLSMVNPIISFLIVDNNEDPLSDINNLALTFDYSLNFYENIENETTSYNFSCDTEVIIEYHRIEDKTEVFFKSLYKKTSVITNKIIQINKLRIYGNFTIDFIYYFNYIQIEIEMD